MPVTAISWLRPLRGGSQTHLLKAADGHHYVVKLSSNPQGIHTLINEWLAQRILSHLKIPCPAVEVIELSQEFLAAHPRLAIQRGQAFHPPPPGWHFGSRFPGDPKLLTVFDILPDIQLATCRNLHHFPAVLAFDKWTANSDSRQCVFYRGRLGETLPEDLDSPIPDPAFRGLVASMIDHGYCFNGIYWDFPDAPGFGLYYRPEVYRKVRGWDDFAPWIERIRNFPTSVLDQALHEIPRAWLDQAAPNNEIEALLETLYSRRDRVPRLIEDVRSRFPNHFPNWR